MAADSPCPALSSELGAKIDAIVQKVKLDTGGWIDLRIVLAVLIDSLKALREEGVALRPDVYLFKETDRNDLRDELGFHHYFQVGAFKRDKAPAAADIVTAAIKKCAPLAKREWSLFIKWTEHEINFGVMRRLASLTKESPRKLIVRSAAVPALLVYQVAEHSIEVRSHSGLVETFEFSAMPRRTTSPEDARQFLVNCCVKAVPQLTIADKTKALLSTILHEAVIEGHGFLVGVQAFDAAQQNAQLEWKEPPVYHPAIHDGNYFQKWVIPLSAKVEMYKDSLEAAFSTHDPDHIGNALDLSGQLRAWADLIPTMLASDGMTLLNTSGQVLGYRVFISELPESERKKPKYQRPPERSGGARWRAFKNMCALVDADILVGAYYQSQDGAAVWYGPEH